jgi:AraC-like DNA-binding protein
MEHRQYIDRIKTTVQAVVHKSTSANEMIAMANYGIICCRRKQRIHRVPFLQPSLVMVLDGQKTVSNGDKVDRCASGEFLGIPAPSAFDMVNQPDERICHYLALCIPFESALVERFLRLYPGMTPGHHKKSAIPLKGYDTLYAAVLHFLQIADSPGQDRDLLEHRLMEILLCLVKHSAASHMLLSMSDQWRQRLASLFLTDPAKAWRAQDVCRLLAVSQSTLRRNLRQENASFQWVLDDVRLGHGLLQIQMTRLPIGQIAANCGYQSASRFSARFRQRFEVTPSQLRKTLSLHQ